MLRINLLKMQGRRPIERSDYMARLAATIKNLVFASTDEAWKDYIKSNYERGV